MKKLRLLLLDANVVIELFSLGLWDSVVAKCEVLLSRIVAEREAKRYSIGVEERSIDLNPYVADKRIEIVDVELSAVRAFAKLFDPTYAERLDPGELEALAYLVVSKEPHLICSADSIVFKVLGRLGRGEQGISLEEVFHKTGLGRKVDWRFSKSFREKYTSDGARDSIQGMGMK